MVWVYSAGEILLFFLERMTGGKIIGKDGSAIYDTVVDSIVVVFV